MKLATIEIISEIVPHSNADKLEIAKVSNFSSIIPKGKFAQGQKVVFIFPDTVLPVADWTAFYKSKSSRVRASKIRGVWSEGIVEDLKTVGLSEDLKIGTEVSKILGIFHYEPPVPNDLSAKGNLPFGLSRTDETRIESLDFNPIGEIGTVTLKVDGQNSNFYCKLKEGGFPELGVTSRNLNLKLDCPNKYTIIEKKYNILQKLSDYCIHNQKSLCLRAENYGNSIQGFGVNPHAAQELSTAIFNVFNLDTHEYEPFSYCEKICNELKLPLIPVLERNVAITQELIEKYKNSEFLPNTKQRYEGVIIKVCNGKSFKIINRVYDSLK